MVRVYVTQEDIDKAAAERGNGRRSLTCPVARAASRAFGGLRIAAAGMRLSLELTNRSTVFDKYTSLPDEVTRFISDVDLHKEVKPLWFDLLPLEEWEESQCAKSV